MAPGDPGTYLDAAVVMDALPFAVLGLTAERRLRFVSRQARALLAETRSVQVAADHLRAADPNDARRLERALEAVLRSKETLPVRFGGALGTVRTHIKSLFSKVAVSRQSELVRLANLLLVLPRGGEPEG